MISVQNEEIYDVSVGDADIIAAYLGDTLIWERVRGDNMWSNTFISRLFLSINGVSVSQTDGDRYEVYTGVVTPGAKYRFTWSASVRGMDNNAPYIRICFFDGSGKFIPPRQIEQITYQGAGSYTVVAPDNAESIDVRIDDDSSTRRQHFEDFQMFAV